MCVFLFSLLIRLLLLLVHSIAVTNLLMRQPYGHTLMDIDHVNACCSAK